MYILFGILTYYPIKTPLFFDELNQNDFIANTYMDDCFVYTKDKTCKIVTDLVKAPVFYPAEEYHQNYAIKNPKEMEEELINSGRIKEKLKKINDRIS